MELRNFFKKNNSKNTLKNGSDFEKKNNKFLKIFGCLALATFMTTTALFAVAPFGTGAANAAAESEMTAQEKLAAGTLNLNPDTDPTIYTTESGLEIKYANGLSLSNYTYFTAGNLNDIDINWIIIGYDPSLSHKVKDLGGDAILGNQPVVSNDKTILDTIDGSIAGAAIYGSSTFISSEAIANSEIGSGCVLCLSEKVLDSITNLQMSGNFKYEASTLQSITQGYYNSLNFPAYVKNLIIPQTFTSGYMAPPNFSHCTSTNQYLFPLAGYEKDANYGISDYNKAQIFLIETYLPTTTLRDCYDLSNKRVGWALRTGYPSYYDNYETYPLGISSLSGSSLSLASTGIRPAFVMKLQ